jgi:hypothetical protein
VYLEEYGQVIEKPFHLYDPGRIEDPTLVIKNLKDYVTQPNRDLEVELSGLPLFRALGKFLGAPPEPPTEPGVLRGNAGSPGTARGPAKVVRSLAEAAKLQPGEVLVSETTSAHWTPLFATAAAIVTDPVVSSAIARWWRESFASRRWWVLARPLRLSATARFWR